MSQTPAAASSARKGSIWRVALGKLGVDVRPGEGVIAALLFAFFCAAITFQYISKPVRQSKFVESLGAETLPIVYLVLAIFAIPAVLLYNRAVDRLQRHHVIAGTCAVVATSVVAFAFVIHSDAAWVPIAFYVWISIAYVMIVSQFWAYSNYILNPRQGKRLFGIIGAGGPAGGLTGALIAGYMSDVAGTQVTVLLSAAILFATIPLLYFIHHFAPDPSEIRDERPRADKLAQSKGGLQAILGSRHLQLIAALMFFTVVVANIIDLQFNWAMGQAVPDPVVAVDANTAWDPDGDIASLAALSAALEAEQAVEVEGLGTPQQDESVLAATVVARIVAEEEEEPEGAEVSQEAAEQPEPESEAAPEPQEGTFGGEVTSVDPETGRFTIEHPNRLDALTGGFGDFYALMNISALVFQLLFTARIHRKLGVGFAMRVLPVVMALGTAGLLIAASVLTRALLSVCLVLKVSENGLRYTLDQATRELLFFPVPPGDRVKSKAYIDVFVQRSGKLGAGLLLLPVFFGLMHPVQAGLLSFGLIAIWLAITVALRSQYVAEFRDGLRKRTVDAHVPLDLSDVTSLEVLVQSLGSADKRQVVYSLELLDHFDKGSLVPPVLVRHESAEVKEKTLALMEKNRRTDAVPLIEEALGDEDSEVRAAALHALVSLQSGGSAAEWSERLDDPDLGMRSAAVASILSTSNGPGHDKARSTLKAMVSGQDAMVRCAAADVMAEIGEPHSQEDLVQLLYDGDLAVQREAIRAVKARVQGGGQNPIFVPTLISLMRDRRLKHEAREALVAYGDSVIRALVHFMNDPEEQIWVRRAVPKTVAQVGGPAAAAALIENLNSTDQFLRRKAIESLGWMRMSEDGLEFDDAVVAEEIYQEVRRYLLRLTDLASIAGRDKLDYAAPNVIWGDRKPLLLERMLADRFGNSVEIIFGLLALVHPLADVRAAHEGLKSGDKALQSHALEYLDNALSGEVHRCVFSVIGDMPLEEKLQSAESRFDLAVQPAEDVLRRLVMASWTDEEHATWLGMAAIHAIYNSQLSELYPQIVEASQRPDDSMVKETAIWASERLGLTTG